MTVVGVINEQLNKTLKIFVQILLTEKIKSTKGAFLGIFDFNFFMKIYKKKFIYWCIKVNIIVLQKIIINYH